MTKDDNRSAAGLRRSAIAERLRIREEWSALKEIERNTLSESPNQETTSMKQQGSTNFVVRFPTTVCKTRNNLKKPIPRRQERLNINEVLRGLVVHVDIGSISKALALRAALVAMGATVSPVWTNLVTHLVWSDGGCRKIRSRARALACKLVSPLWVEACAAAGRRLPESMFPAASRPSDLPSPNTLKRMLKKVEQENIPLNLLVDSQESEKNKAPHRQENDKNKAPHSQVKEKNKAPHSQENEKNKAPHSQENEKNKAPHSQENEKNKAPHSQENHKNKAPHSQENEKNKSPRLRISSDTDTSHNTTADKSKSTTKNRNEPDIQARVNTAPRRALPLSTSPEQPTKSKRRLFTHKEDETLSGDGTDEDLTPARPITLKYRKMTQKNNQLNREIVKKFVGTMKTNNKNLKATQSSDKGPRIVLTGMSRQERQEMIKAIKQLKGKIQSTVNKKTTHIILGTCGYTDNINCNKCNSVEKILSQMFETNLAVRDVKRTENVCKCITLNKEVNDLNTSLLDQGRGSQENHNPIERIPKTNKPRTLNTLLGAVRGCRILYSKWALDSLKVNRWVHHFGYEVKHLKKISEKARFERSAFQKLHSEYTYNVFDGAKIHISQNAEQKDALTQLLTVCGAEIQNDGQDDTDSDIRIGRENGEICSKWVFDSIAAGRLRTTRRYINRNIPIEVVNLNQ